MQRGCAPIHSSQKIAAQHALLQVFASAYIRKTHRQWPDRANQVRFSQAREVTSEIEDRSGRLVLFCHLALATVPKEREVAWIGAKTIVAQDIFMDRQ